MSRKIISFLNFFVLLLVQYSVCQQHIVCPTGFVYQQNVCVQTVTTTPCQGNSNQLHTVQQINNVVCSTGYTPVNGNCIQAQCPNTHVWTNGLCLLQTNCNHNQQIVNTLYGSSLCNNVNCQMGCSQSVVAPPTTPPPTQPPPPPTPVSTCPPCPGGTIAIECKCYPIFCPQGAMVNGRCVRVTCTNGTVWTGSECEEPTQVKTILEVQNVFHFNVTHVIGDVTATSNNNITVNNAGECQSDSENDNGCKPMPSTTARPSPTTNTPTPTLTRTATLRKCCVIISPRMCRMYGSRWVCFHRRYNRCAGICDASFVYIKTSKVIVQSEIVVVPPQIPLKCNSVSCNEAAAIDCSGCANHHREYCSSYCYNYTCPKGTDCSYVDQQEYCYQFPGEQGCLSTDGCFSDWCSARR